MDLQLSKWLHQREDHVMRAEGTEYKGWHLAGEGIFRHGKDCGKCRDIL